MRNAYNLRLLFVIIVAVLAGQFAFAQVELAPEGERATSLRAKKVDADIDIRGGFAQTTVVTTFQNELSEQREADFSYVAPPGAVVTGFAYWFKGEKVIARVVEKERALQIYRRITTPRGDPALVEQVDERIFRARIFPVEANADLRVEIKWVQVLDTDEKGLLYCFPLKGEGKAASTLESLDVKATVFPETASQRVVNSYNLPQTEDEGKSQTFSLSRKNFKATEDLTVRIERPQTALGCSVYAAQSGGKDGFFVLALTPNQNLKNPRVKITGLPIYDLLCNSPLILKAQQTLLVTGRYRKGGTGVVELSGYAGGAARRSIAFAPSRSSNNLATKFWALMKIKSLSRDIASLERNREQVIELSTRYTLPSRITSWLAIPVSEWNAWKVQIANEEIRQYGRLLAQLREMHLTWRADYKKMYARFEASCRVLKMSGEQGLRPFVQEREKWRMEAEANELYNRRHRLLGDLGEEVAAHGARTKKARNLERAVATMARRLNKLPTNRWKVGAAKPDLAWVLDNFTYDWAVEMQSEKPRPQELARLSARKKRLSSYAGLDLKAVESSQMMRVLEDNLYSVSQKLATAMDAGNATGAAQVKDTVRQRAIQFGGNAEYLLQTLEKQAKEDLRLRAINTQKELMAVQYGEAKDAGKVAALQTKVERYLQLSQAEREEVLRNGNYFWASGKPEEVARTIVAEKAKDNPNQKLIDENTAVLEVMAAAINDYDKHQGGYGHPRDAADFIASSESDKYGYAVQEIYSTLALEERLQKPNVANLERWKKQVETIYAHVTPRGRERLEGRNNDGVAFYTAHQQFEEELHKAVPDEARLAQLEEAFVKYQNYDYNWNRSHYNWIADAQQYGRVRAERIKTRVAREKLESIQRTSATKLTKAEKAGLEEQRIALAAKEDELRSRMGDPLIAVAAPEDAAQVLAVMPEGGLKKMVFNAGTKRWEAHFDIPEHAAEGQYEIRIIIVLKDGTRQQLRMTFQVDITAPSGSAKARVVGETATPTLRLDIDCDDDTARVTAVLPWGDRQDLSFSTQEKSRFFGLVNIPEEYADKPMPVEFVLTDKAHNRTTIALDDVRATTGP